MNILKKTVKKKNLYKEYVQILNGKLQLSDRELQVLSFFVMIDTEWSPKTDSDYKHILSTDNRRLVMNDTLINKNNLSKYIKILKDKNLLVENEFGGFEINPMIRPVFKDNTVSIGFMLEIENSNE